MSRRGWSAAELPFLADTLVEVMVDAADLWGRAASTDHTLAGAADYQSRAADLVCDAASGSLIWVDTSLCRMVEETAPTVPGWSPGAVAPSDAGIMCFDRPVAPLVWRDEGESLPTTCDGVAWRVQCDRMVLMLLTRLRAHRDRLSPIRARAPMVGSVSVSLPVSGEIGAGAEFGGDEPEVVEESARAGLAAVGACWLLMAQESVVEESDTAVPAPRRRRAAGVAEVASPVVSVSERRLRRRAVARGDGGRGSAVSRWWVRGHWRQQPYGPGRSLRKPVFIEAHTAGAKGVPVSERRRVERWRE